MTDKSIHAIIEGKVQGVYFRDCTRKEAKRLGLVGWVRNLPDGSVETLIYGEKINVDAMLAWLQRGSPMSVVTRVNVSEGSKTDEIFTDFTIRY